MKSKLDKTWVGFLTGLLAPVIAMAIYYMINFRHLTLKEFYIELTSRDIIGHIISLCALPNLLLFFIFIWLSLYKGARGVIISTFLYAFVIVGIRYL